MCVYIYIYIYIYIIYNNFPPGLRPSCSRKGVAAGPTQTGSNQKVLYIYLSIYLSLSLSLYIYIYRYHRNYRYMYIQALWHYLSFREFFQTSRSSLTQPLAIIIIWESNKKVLPRLRHRDGNAQGRNAKCYFRRHRYYLPAAKNISPPPNSCHQAVLLCFPVFLSVFFHLGKS